MTDAVLSIAEADAIRAGLGEVSDSVPAAVLAVAAQQLVREGAEPAFTADLLGADDPERTADTTKARHGEPDGPSKRC